MIYQMIEQIVGSAVPVLIYRPDEIIFNEGDTGRELYIIKQGTVAIFNRKRFLALLQPDDIFGEMALLDDKPRSATATARGEVTLIPISKRDFTALISKSPIFALAIMRVLTRRLRQTNIAI